MDCAYVELQDEEHIKSFVPYRFGLYNTIDNILVLLFDIHQILGVKINK